MICNIVKNIEKVNNNFSINYELVVFGIFESFTLTQAKSKKKHSTPEM